MKKFIKRVKKVKATEVLRIFLTFVLILSFIATPLITLMAIFNN